MGRGPMRVTESYPLFGYDLEDYDVLFAEKLDLLDEAAEILYGDGGTGNHALEIPDIQEGEISITNLWFDLEEKRAKRDGKPFDRATAKPPMIFDFRMFVAD